MRLLFISNYYPPFARGGYEQWCAEIAQELSQRGYRVTVLTSRSTDNRQAAPHHNVEVRRTLYLEVEGGLVRTTYRLLRDRQRCEQANVMELQQVVATVQPDVALLWGMWNMPRSAPAYLEQALPHRVAYYLCDYWPVLPNTYLQQWRNPARRGMTQVPKHMFSRVVDHYFAHKPVISLQMQHPICVSQRVRDILGAAEPPIKRARIIYGGTSLDVPTAAHNNSGRPPRHSLKLVYVGRLTPEKGVHTAIRALALLAHRIDRPITLDLIGSGSPDYERELKTLVQRSGLEGYVSFRGSLPRDEMPTALTQYDALLFPSEWEEPFARTVLEAMAARLVVIGTITGGTGEVLLEGETGLTFPAGDAAALARQIQHLHDNRPLRTRLAEAGRERVRSRFTFKRMADELESALQEIAESAKAERCVTMPRQVFSKRQHII